jgi:DNA-binding FrmR family transcriptional regulator
VVGYGNSKADLLKRLNRAEGKVCGVHCMVDNDTYCIDVLIQVTAATKSLDTVAISLLEDHLSRCVAEAIVLGGAVADEKIRDANAASARLSAPARA